MSLCRLALLLLTLLFATNTLAGLSASKSTSTNGSYSLSWNDNGAPTTLQESANGGSWKTAATSGTSKSFSGKKNGTYKYRLKRSNPWLGSTWYEGSITVKVSIPVPKPGTPSSISRPNSVSGSSVTVRWGSASGTVSRYELEQSKNNGAYDLVYSGEDLSAPLSLAQGAYTFRVRACKNSECSGFRTAAAMYVEGSGNLTISTLTTTTGSYSTSWTPTLAPYTIPYFYEQVNNGPWVKIAQEGSHARNYSKTVNGTYSYKVDEIDCTRAFINQPCFKVAGTNIVSVVVNRPPAPGTPGALSHAVNENSSVTFSWGASSGSVTAYHLEQKNGASWTRLYSDSSIPFTADISTGTYDFRIRACNGSSCSDWRSLNSASIKRSEYIRLSQETSTDGNYTLIWSSDTFFGESEIIEVSHDGAATNLNINGSGGSKIFDKDYNGTYQYSLRTYDCSVAGAPPGTPVDSNGCIRLKTYGPVNVLVNIPPPEPPSNFTASSSSSTGISLSWDPSPSTNIDGYVVSYESLAGVTQTVGETGTSLLLPLNKGLWSFKVKAIRKNTESTEISTSISGGIIGSSLQITNTESVTGQFGLSWSGVQSTYPFHGDLMQVGASGIPKVLLKRISTTGSYTHSVCQSGNYRYYVQVHDCINQGNTLPDAPTRDCVLDKQSNDVAVTVDLSALPWACSDADVPDIDYTNLQPLPSNTVGSLPAKASVNGGSAAYQVPLAVPPGRNGQQPNVALSYSSRGGNGIAGVGWSLSPQSSISRCPATYAQDGFVSDVQYSASRDRLCLNGARLMAVSGSYGQSGTVYRLESDNFTQVTQRGGGINSSSVNFKVDYKNGTSAYFGSDSESRVIQQGAPGVLSWLVAYEHDTVRNSSGAASNYIHYEYQTVGAGEVLLKNIYYTGNSSGFSGRGDRQVSFQYDYRPDSTSAYLAGGFSQKTQRLNRIETHVAGDLINQYTLTYEQSPASQRSILASLQQCDDSANCLPETVFDWHKSRTIAEPETLKLDGQRVFSGVDYLHDIMPQGDLDGDGTRDFPGVNTDAEQHNTGTNDLDINHSCYRSYSTVGRVQCIEMDIDQDGINDAHKVVNSYLHIQYSSEANDYGTAQYKNTGILVRLPSQGDSVSTAFDRYKKRYDQIMSVSDLDGDSYPDLLISTVNRGLPGQTAGRRGAVDLNVYRHNGSATAPFYNNLPTKTIYSLALDGTAVGDQEWDVSPNEAASLHSDMDGNGLTDLVVEITTHSNFGGLWESLAKKILLNKSSPGNFVFESKTAPSFGVSGSDIASHAFFNMFVDVNGDSRADFIGWDNGRLALKLNQGDASYGATQYLSSHYFLDTRTYKMDQRPAMVLDMYLPKYNDSIKVADVNGDGRPELLVPGERLVSYCSEILSQNYCGDALYGDISYSSNAYSTQPISSYHHDSSIYRYDAIYFDEDVRGDFRVRKEATDIIGSATQSAMIDAFGDGNIDMLFVHGKGYNRQGKSTDYSGSSSYWLGVFGSEGAYISRNYGAGNGSSTSAYEPVDVLKKVTNGLAQQQHWRYRPLASSETSAADKPLYDTDHDYMGAGYFHFGSSMYVVQSLKQDNGVGGLNETQYGYRGAVYNLQGRGFMGFRSIVTEDKQSALVSHTDFHQKFPNAGAVQYQAQYRRHQYPLDYPVFDPAGDCASGSAGANANSALSFSQHCYQRNTAHKSDMQRFSAQNRVQHWYRNSSTSIVRDLQSQAEISTTTVDVTDIDRWGNSLASSQVLSDDWGRHQTDTAVVIDNSSTQENDWWLTKVDQTETTHYAVDLRNSEDPYSGTELDETITTTVVNLYEQSNVRQPTSVSVFSSDSSAQGSETVTAYNNYGLPVSVTNIANVMSSSGSWQEQSRELMTLSYSRDGSTEAADGYFPLLQSNQLGHSVVQNTLPATGQVSDIWRQLDAANDHHTRTFYDSLNRPEEIQVQGQATQYLRYRDPGLNAPAHAVVQIEITQAATPAQTRWQDGFGRTLRTAVEGFDGGWVYTDREYDNRGLVTFESVPYAGVQTLKGVHYGDYDALGRPGYKHTDQDCGGKTEARYTYTGLRTDITAEDTCNFSTLYMSRTYNSLKQLVQTIDQANGVTSYAYNSVGSPIVIRDAQGNSITARYDGLGRKVALSDPNQGDSTFVYNGFGELQREERAGAHTIDYSLDVLGRTTQRRATGEPTLDYVFDEAANGFGQLAEERGNGLTRQFSYNSNGQLTDTLESHSGKTYKVSTEYDSGLGRVKALSYPNGLKLAYKYLDNGYLHRVENASNAYVFREISAQDVWGNIVDGKFGNGITETASYSAVTGQVKWLEARNFTTSLQRFDYNQYDGFGNIRSVDTQLDNMVSQDSFNESFDYDDLHRLTANRINGIGGVDYRYDSLGNLTQKSDYGLDYDYAGTGAGPNAVKRVQTLSGDWVSFGYDARGNMTSGDGLSSAMYNAMDKPTSLVKNSASLSFSYGPDHMRFKQVKQASGKTISTTYVGKLYEEESVDGEATKWRAYLGDFAILSGELSAMVIPVESPVEGEATDTAAEDVAADIEMWLANSVNNQIRYQHRDRLGSARTMTDTHGMVVVQRNFDPFGKPREANGSDKFASVLGDLAIATTNRGFTDHEHLDEAELIHMNGRVYDYNLGRFMSVDPFIQAPGNSQSINPYSYVMNNPLAGVDPTGYAWTNHDSGFGGTYTPSDVGADGKSHRPGGDKIAGVGAAMTQAVSNHAAGAISNGATTTQDSNEKPSGGGGNQGGVSDIGGQGGMAIGGLTNVACDMCHPVENFNPGVSELGDQGASLLADVTPGVGSVKSFGQLITGQDLITGDPVNRWLEGLGVALGVFPGGKLLTKGDEFVDLYHGVKNLDDAANIRKGVDLSLSRKNLDFGSGGGFYTTTDYKQAADWAGGNGSVLHFKVKASELSNLNNLNFSGATSSWGRFVRHNRSGGRMHSFDTVSGPMLRARPFFKRGATSGFGQQTSWHTQKGIELLMKGVQ